MSIKDLSPKFKIPIAEKELERAMAESLMGERAGGLSLFSDSFKRGYGDAVFGSDANGIWLGAADFADAPFKVGMDGALTATTATITGMGQNFVSTLVWTATDIDTASWSSGTIKTNDGTSYAIDAGNTGDITNDVYVYLDPNTSITVLQQSTDAADAAGESIILIAIVQKGIAGSECVIDVVGSIGTTIDGGQITTGTITADKIVTGVLVVGTNVGIGTAEDSAGVTTIIGSTVTTAYVNALSVNAATIDASVSITSPTITGGTIAIGTGDAIFKADSSGIYLGDAVFADAPFRVSMAGNVVLNSWSLNDGDITAYTSGMVFKNTKGLYFWNSAGDALIGLLDVNSSNKTRLNNTVGQVGIVAGNTEGFLMSTDGSVDMNYGVGILGGLDVTGGLNLLSSITATDGSINLDDDVVIASGQNLTFAGTQGSINCGTINCDTITTNRNTITCGNISSYAINMNNYALTNVDSITMKDDTDIKDIGWLNGYNDLNLKSVAQNKILFDSTTEDSGGDDLSMYPHWGDFYATGSKNFRIDHPDNPKKQWIQYTSVESPEVVLKIRGRATLVNGEAVVETPRHWHLVTEEHLTTVILTPLEDCKGLFAPKVDLTKDGFKVKELGGGTSNIEFCWELTATRFRYSGYNPEQTVDAEAERMANSLVEGEERGSIMQEIKSETTQKHLLYRNLVAEKYKALTGKDHIGNQDEIIKDE